MIRSKSVAAIAAAWLLTLGCGRDPEVAKREYMKSGDAYAAQQKFREATLQYRNAVALDPRFGEARSKLADAYAKSGDAAAAYREYIRAADLLPNDVQAQLRAGQVLLLARKFEDAKARADKALALAPANVDAHILKGNSLAGLKNYPDAIAEVEAAIKADPERGTSHAKLGYLQLAKGDRAEAERAFKRAVDVAHGATGARLALANFYMASGEQGEAEQALLEALATGPDDLAANQMLAQFYIASGRPAEAEAPLKKIAELLPDGTGRLQLADYYLAARRLPDARAVLDALAQADVPSSTKATLRLAEIAVAGGDRATAYRLIQEVRAKEPQNGDALAALCDLQIGDRKLDDALASAQAAVRGDPRSVRFQFTLGRVRAARHDYADAIAALTESLRLDPRFAPAELELARVHLAQRNVQQAIHFADSAVKKAPRSADARLLLARAQLMSGNAPAAEASMKELAAAFPDTPAVLVQVGQVEAMKRNLAAARRAFERALARDPVNAEAIEWLTRLDLLERKPASARARIQAAVARAPQDPAIQLAAAQFHYSVEDYPQAEAALRAVLAADPGVMQAYARLGQLYAKQNRLAEAVAEFDRAARDHPRDIAMPTAAAVIVQMQNRTEEARTRYERILAIDSRAAVAANNLAWIYAESGGNLDLALQLAQAAKSQLTDRGEVSDTLGWVYYKKGLSTLAAQSFTEAVAADPDNALFHYHLGLAHAASKNTLLARTALERAIAIDPRSENAADARKLLDSLPAADPKDPLSR